MNGLELRYFVLKPGAKGEHGRACRNGIRAYAETIRKDQPQLAKDLEKWAYDESVKAGDIQ